MTIPGVPHALLAHPAPTSAHDAVRLLEARYESLLSSGKFEPFLYPWGTAGAAIIILFLLLDHRDSRLLQQLRIPVWLCNGVISLYAVFYQRARNPAGALGIGIISGWSMLWTGVLLVFNDCQRDYMRIERRIQSPPGSEPQSDGHGLGISTGRQVLGETNEGQPSLRPRPQANGLEPESKDGQPPSGKYFWQQYPASFTDRLDWVVDLFTTFRGTAWNWRVAGLAPPPKHVTSCLTPESAAPEPSRPPIVHTHPDRRSLLRHNLFIFLRNALILDILKTLVSHDPYFWGQVNTPVPPPYIPTALHFPAALRFFRLLIALGLMKFALQLIFSLGPLFFVGLLPPHLFPVRAEAWDHPDQFGPFSFVFTKGLAGWWGGFWHQTFRKGFEAPGQRAVEALGLEPRSLKGKVVQLFIAFGLSGLLHACGSMTEIGETRPLRGPFVFFLSQAVGITIEMGAKMWLKQKEWSQHIPSWLGQLGNFVFAHCWLYITAPWMVEDFSKGGVWLFEPLPVSIFRGPLRLGDAEDGFWRWHGTFAKWHTGDTWWKTGIAL
ncbi:membrane bound O-acyl transferase family-domain-containing protein [Elsinoe ampelina]|uniref:Membrane bound O-acyl transferase family-domain-containing protein n=1 Tax=Elsinoe ampelina TaxID=302913 RepID=A0A6A6GLR8_9PEZI|nr:membrane bound O-acyl transferase family-domain-containing protein [Elsinoe ampelina]